MRLFYLRALKSNGSAAIGVILKWVGDLSEYLVISRNGIG